MPTPTPAQRRTKSFGANIPEEDYLAFKELVPIYGGSQWFIETTIREFIAAARRDPSIVEHARASVQAMLERNRESEQHP